MYEAPKTVFVQSSSSMSEYGPCISGKTKTIWGKFLRKKDELIAKFRLKRTSRSDLLQNAAASKVIFKILFQDLPRASLKFFSSTVYLGFLKDSTNWSFYLKTSSSTGFAYNF